LSRAIATTGATLRERYSKLDSTGRPKEEEIMRFNKRFLRENLGGLSLTLIGVLTLGLSFMLYQGNHLFPGFALAQSKGLDGPDINVLERQNEAYERIAKVVSPAIVAIKSTRLLKFNNPRFLAIRFFVSFLATCFRKFPASRRNTRWAAA
jgi:hypothetical protein